MNTAPDVRDGRSESTSRADSVALWVFAGVLVAVFSAAVGYLAAGVFDTASPVGAVADGVIDGSPTAVKRWAISTLGTADKPALGIGIVVIMAMCAVGLMRLARDQTWALSGVAAFVAVGAWAMAPLGFSEVMVLVLTSLLTLGALWWIANSFANSTAMSAPVAQDPTLGWASSLHRRSFITRATALSVASVGAAGLGVAVTRQKDSELIAAAPQLPSPDNPSDSLMPLTDGLDFDDEPFGSRLEPFVTPRDDFYRIDTAFTVPRVAIDEWTLRIDGMVEQPLALNFEQLLERRVIERAITLCCVSNEVGGSLIGNAVWLGIPLSDLLDEVRPQADATQLASESADGWTCGFPTELATDGRDAMVAVGMNGEPLPIEHGFPARLVVPGLYGYVSATKWLTRITLTTLEDFDGYWITRGWSKDGPVKTQSRIDTPSQGGRVTAGTLPIAGVAWAQHRGINKVEVRIDSGEWMPAKLAEEHTIDTWRQWVLRWDATEGEHSIEVRATDGFGETQTGQVSPVAPDGATGYHQVSVTVEPG